MCEAFLLMNMQMDEAFQDRVLSALNEYGHEIHGILTLRDPWLEAACGIAQRLGLPYQPAEALYIWMHREREIPPDVSDPRKPITLCHVSRRPPPSSSYP